MGWTKYNRQEMFFLIVLVGAASDDNCGKNSHSTPSNLIHPQENVPLLHLFRTTLFVLAKAWLFIYL